GWSGVAAGGGRGERDGRGVGRKVARAVACSYVDLVFGVGGQPGQGDRVGGGLAEQRVGGALLPVDVVTRQAGAALELPHVFRTLAMKTPMIIRKDVPHARTSPARVPTPRGRARAPRRQTTRPARQRPRRQPI